VRRLVHPSCELRLIEDCEQLVGFCQQAGQVGVIAGLRCRDEFEPVDAFVGLLDDVSELGFFNASV